MLEGRIFVTGGAGYLARAIYARAAAENWAAQFTCFSRDDGKHAQLRNRFPSVRCIRGDICQDTALLAAGMMGHDVVIHAAAIKYVDLAETNVFDTIRVNIDGSRNVFLAAHIAGIKRVIAISTDKACEPVNIYGATKFAMERMIHEADRLGETNFVGVRYGNVVGSTGSVIPKFKQQLEALGHVEITDPSMTRFWMSHDEAVDVVLAAMATPRGTILIPACRAMGLEAMVHAAIGDGLPRMIKVVGPRPGEKRAESLVGANEAVRTEPSGIMRTSASKVWAGWLLHPPGVYPILDIGDWAQFPFTSDDAPAVSPQEMRAMSEASEHV